MPQVPQCCIPTAHMVLYLLIMQISDAQCQDITGAITIKEMLHKDHATNQKSAAAPHQVLPPSQD